MIDGVFEILRERGLQPVPVEYSWVVEYFEARRKE
jgi:hypothetical protein